MRSLHNSAPLIGADAGNMTSGLLSRPELCAELLCAHYRREPDGGSRPVTSDGLEQVRIVLVVDQFEEIFTACQDEAERRSFIGTLRAAAQCDEGGARRPGGRGPAALVVLGLRADFYPHALRYPEMVPALQHHQVVVGPMTEAELRSAIVEPTHKARLEIEEGLVQVLLRDLAPAGHSGSAAAHDVGALPLLSHALMTTWERARRGDLTVADYESTGGIQGAVAGTAEEVYADLTPDQQDLARQIFIRLILSVPKIPSEPLTCGVREWRRSQAQLVHEVGSTT
jgi:hypothetical protein